LLGGVGQAGLACRSGMPESPLLFSVPACGSFLLRSQVVHESTSPGVGDQKPTARPEPHSGRRRTVLLKIAPQSSFPRRRESTVPRMGPRSPAFAEDKFRGDDGGFQNWGNKARMYMKTRDEVKMSMRMTGAALDEKPRSPNTGDSGPSTVKLQCQVLLVAAFTGRAT